MLPHYKATIKAEIKEQTNRLPSVKIDYHPHRDPRTKFNQTKLAILIEGRPMPHLVPQILHMISVVPPDWRFLFLGSNKSVISVGRSLATQVQQADGKLDLMTVPKKWGIDSKEDIYRMLTDLEFYEKVIPGVEWLLKYEADSIMCANSGESLNNWLNYSWAGAPKYDTDPFAGNGGLTFRRVSAVKQVLSFQSRYNDTESEDEWFGKRIIVLPNALVASASMQEYFSVEGVWHEKPMGYHVPDGGTRLPEDVWKSRNRRKKIFEYCPEVSMIMPMKLEKERCQGDLRNGKIGPGLQPGRSVEEAIEAGRTEKSEEENEEDEHLEEDTEENKDEENTEENNDEENKEEENQEEENQEEENTEESQEENTEENQDQANTEEEENEEDNSENEETA